MERVGRPRPGKAKEQVGDLLLVVEVGRLELWPASSSAAWSRLRWLADLRFLMVTIEDGLGHRSDLTPAATC